MASEDCDKIIRKGASRMYIPKYYRLTDRDEIGALLTSSPFGTLVAVDGGAPIAVHMPFEWREEGERLILEGHVSRGNRIWRVAPDNGEVLVMFQGPHAYISSSWYEDPNVPTWNYLAAHVYGSCCVLTDDQLAVAMRQLLNHYEAGRPQGRTWEALGDAFLEREMRGIVGLRIEVSRIEAAKKMSQNRNAADFAHIIEKLEESGRAEEQAVADIMRQVRPESR